jgi:hypothetical protein
MQTDETSVAATKSILIEASCISNWILQIELWRQIGECQQSVLIQKGSYSQEYYRADATILA